MLYDNAGTPIDGNPVEEPNDFSQQCEDAYAVLAGCVDGMLEELPRGAIMMALTRLQFEQNGAMVVDLVEHMMDSRAEGKKGEEANDGE